MCPAWLPQQAYGFERIISLGPINTENVFLLGAEARLVGNTSYCTRPDEARNKEKIGSVLQISIEKIISLQPDLVLATALTRPEQVGQLERGGIRVVRFKQPASFDEICLQFLELGRLLGLPDTAQNIVATAQEEVARIRAEVAGLERQKVLIQVGAQPLFGAVPSSFTHDFIDFAGGINILAHQQSGATGQEQVIVHNPDIIIVAIMGSETGVAGQEQARWLRIPVLKAVQANRVFIIEPDLLCSPSPSTFAQTLRQVAYLIHPEIQKKYEDL